MSKVCSVTQCHQTPLMDHVGDPAQDFMQFAVVSLVLGGTASCTKCPDVASLERNNIIPSLHLLDALMPGWSAFIAVTPGQFGVHESAEASCLQTLAWRAAPSSPSQPVPCTGLVCLGADTINTWPAARGSAMADIAISFSFLRMRCSSHRLDFA